MYCTQLCCVDCVDCVDSVVSVSGCTDWPTKQLHQYQCASEHPADGDLYKDINVAEQSSGDGGDFLFGLSAFSAFFLRANFADGLKYRLRKKNPSKSLPTLEAINLWLIPNLINSSAFGIVSHFGILLFRLSCRPLLIFLIYASQHDSAWLITEIGKRFRFSALQLVGPAGEYDTRNGDGSSVRRSLFGRTLPRTWYVFISMITCPLQRGKMSLFWEIVFVIGNRNI